MTKVYLKCVRVGGVDWESAKEGGVVMMELGDGGRVSVAVGDVFVVEGANLTSLFNSLSDDQKQAVLGYEGPEDHGDPEWRRGK